MQQVNGHSNGVDGKSTFRVKVQAATAYGQLPGDPARVVTPRWVVKLASGRELVVYAATAKEAKDLLILGRKVRGQVSRVGGGFDSYEKNASGMAELRHTDLSIADIAQVHQEGGKRADGQLDFGGRQAVILDDKAPARETQTPKPAK